MSENIVPAVLLKSKLLDRLQGSINAQNVNSHATQTQILLIVK